MILTDDARDERNIPTRENMLEGMKWLVEGAKAHDALFFHCRYPASFKGRPLLSLYLRLWSWRSGA